MVASEVKPTVVQTTLPGTEDAVIGTIVLAFDNDPPARWLFPEPHQYLANFPRFTRAFGGNAFASQTAFHTPGFGGAALWLPPGVEPDEAALVAIIEEAVEADRRSTVFGLLEALARFHPHGPHWYLPMIGVDPAHQGQGLGTTLLRDTLMHVDDDHLPAYLESTNPMNIPLYKRHGFELQATIRIGTAPPLFPMLRPAR